MWFHHLTEQKCRTPETTLALASAFFGAFQILLSSSNTSKQTLTNEKKEHALWYAIICLVFEVFEAQYNFKTMEACQIPVYTEVFSGMREVVRNV